MVEKMSPLMGLSALPIDYATKISALWAFGTNE
jgi:hypothetical protein